MSISKALAILFFTLVINPGFAQNESKDLKINIQSEIDSSKNDIEERSKAAELKLKRSEQSIDSYLNYLGVATLILAALVGVGFMVRERQKEN